MWAVELGGKLGFCGDTEVKRKNKVFQEDSNSLYHMLLDNKTRV